MRNYIHKSESQKGVQGIVGGRERGQMGKEGSDTEQSNTHTHSLSLSERQRCSAIIMASIIEEGGEREEEDKEEEEGSKSVLEADARDN